MRSIVRGACALLLVLMVGYVAFHLGSSSARSRVVAVASTTTPSADRSALPTSVPSVSADPAWATTAQRFVGAFLDHSRTRGVRLRAVASPRLATLLARTDLSKIPGGDPDGQPKLVAETASTVTVSQQLSDGSSIAFNLVPDATRAGGWVVTTVRSGSS